MMVKINNEEYLTAAEAARFLGVSPTTFVKLQKENHLRYMTRRGLGNKKFFKQKDLEPFLEFKPGEEDGNKS